MVGRWVALAGLLLATSSAGGQDLPAQLSGRLESSYLWTEQPRPDGNQGLGRLEGWLGVTGGTNEVKSELRLGFSNLPSPSLTLGRAWVKFRFPGLRFTTGLGRLAWGPGLVLVPGDLLFEATGLDVDELRTPASWLADAWISLGDEAFAEVSALKDTAGLRISATPSGATWEAAGAWDRRSQTVKTAVSSQFHLGLDWYATVRDDFCLGVAPDLGRLQTAAGAFGLWNWVEGVSVSARTEILVSPTDVLARWKSYHDLNLAFDDGWSWGGRLLVDRGLGDWTPSVQVAWAALQDLNLSVTVVPRTPWSVQAAAAARW